MQKGRLSGIIETEKQELGMLVKEAKRCQEIVDCAGSEKNRLVKAFGNCWTGQKGNRDHLPSLSHRQGKKRWAAAIEKTGRRGYKRTPVDNPHCGPRNLFETRRKEIKKAKRRFVRSFYAWEFERSRKTGWFVGG